MYGKAVTEGFQGYVEVPGSVLPHDSRYNKIANMMKHWTAYSVESNWWEGAPQGRMGFDANISVHDLVDTYFVGMRMAAEANISSAMCAYDAINGTPSCLNGWMSNTIARKTWGWEGTIYTDCGALTNVNKHFHRFEPPNNHPNRDELTAAAAIKQGTDLECDSVLKTNLGHALNHSLLDTTDLRKSVYRTFLMFMKLGMFDDVRKQPMANVNDTSIVAGTYHRQLALEAARESVVLLQNPLAEGGKRKILPLSHGQSLFVGGPSANLTDAFLGEYRPVPCADGSTDCLPTALQAISSLSKGTVLHAAGCTDGPQCTGINTDAAVTAAKASDVTILVVGLKYGGEGSSGGQQAAQTNGEGRDRHNITLPGKQQSLCEAVIAVGKPTVLVVLGGGSVSVGFAKDHASVAIVSMGSGGQAGAQALAEVLFGSVTPSGRLPHTMYGEGWEVQTPMSDMSMQAGPGRSYRWLDVAKSKPLFEFGSGLSFTSFDLELNTTAKTTTQVIVKNTGAVAGANVVLLFSTAKCDEPPPLVPAKSLIDFARTETLAPGASEALSFEVDDKQLALVGESGTTLLCKGSFELSFFDGVTTKSTSRTVAASSVISTIPQPPPQR